MKGHIVRTCLLTCTITGELYLMLLKFSILHTSPQQHRISIFCKSCSFLFGSNNNGTLNLNFTELTELGKLSFSLTHCGRLIALLTLILYFHHYVSFEFFPLKQSIFPYPMCLIWSEQWNRSYSTQASRGVAWNLGFKRPCMFPTTLLHPSHHHEKSILGLPVRKRTMRDTWSRATSS